MNKRFDFACPYCFEKHAPEVMLLRCAKKGCDNIIKVEKYDFIEVKSISKCLRCKKSDIELHCPNEYYGFSSGTEGIIPGSIIKAPNISIAVTGDQNAGKTCYMGALLVALRSTFRRFFGGELSNVDERSDRLFKEYYLTPMTQNHTLPTVKKGLDGSALPVCFYLSIVDRLRNNITGTLSLNYSPTTAELILKTPEEKENMLGYMQIFAANYIKNASVIFLIIDPMTIPHIAKCIREQAQRLGESRLVENCSPAKEGSDKITAKILKNIIALLRQEDIEDGKDDEKRIEKPLAVIFTKLDLIKRYYIPMSGSNRLRRESHHLETHSYNRREHKITSEEIISLLVSHMGDETVNLMRNFKTYSFFAVSALGDAPDLNNRISKKTPPERILDPVLWALSNGELIEKSW